MFPSSYLQLVQPQPVSMSLNLKTTCAVLTMITTTFIPTLMHVPAASALSALPFEVPVSPPVAHRRTVKLFHAMQWKNLGVELPA